MILGHLLLHGLARHGGHAGKAQGHGQQTEQAQPPVKGQQQHQQSGHRGHGPVLVGELVGQKGLRRPGGVGNGAAELAAAGHLNLPQGQAGDVLCEGQAQIGGDAEGGQVGAHQPRDVQQDGQHGKAHRPPAPGDDVNGGGKVGGGLQHLL